MKLSICVEEPYFSPRQYIVIMRQRESMSKFQRPMCVMLSSTEFEALGGDNCFSLTAILGRAISFMTASLTV